MKMQTAPPRPLSQKRSANGLPSAIHLFPREQLYNRYCSDKQQAPGVHRARLYVCSVTGSRNGAALYPPSSSDHDLQHTPLPPPPPLTYPERTQTLYSFEPMVKSMARVEINISLSTKLESKHNSSVLRALVLRSLWTAGSEPIFIPALYVLPLRQTLFRYETKVCCYCCLSFVLDLKSKDVVRSFTTCSTHHKQYISMVLM